MEAESMVSPGYSKCANLKITNTDTEPTGTQSFYCKL